MLTRTPLSSSVAHQDELSHKAVNQLWKWIKAECLETTTICKYPLQCRQLVALPSVVLCAQMIELFPLSANKKQRHQCPSWLSREERATHKAIFIFRDAKEEDEGGEEVWRFATGK